MCEVWGMLEDRTIRPVAVANNEDEAWALISSVIGSVMGNGKRFRFMWVRKNEHSGQLPDPVSDCP